MLLLILCLLAPAPAPRENPPVVIQGDYVLHWGEAKFDCSVDRDGCWDCYSGQTHWIGGIEIDGNTVTLREAVLHVESGTTGSEQTYRMRLNADLAGQTDSGLAVRLVRRLGPVE